MISESRGVLNTSARCRCTATTFFLAFLATLAPKWYAPLIAVLIVLSLTFLPLEAEPTKRRKRKSPRAGNV